MPDKPLAGVPSERRSKEAHPQPAPGTAFPVVGLGASAGGLEALVQLLRALPVDTGMAFVIVQHLSPTRASSLATILSRATTMEVCEVSEDCGESTVEPNHVYVIPPGRDLRISKHKLCLIPQESHPLHRGIDQFFRSLAKDCRHQAIGVVLSGFLSDGTVGLEEIKAEGGITFAQDDSALHDSMPRHAEASGCVDFVLPPEEIAREIARIARHPYVAPQPADADADADQDQDGEGLGHTRIAQILLTATGVNFANYKTNTLHRRISRRMLLHKLETLAEYEAYLQQTPAEVEALFQDILINVTSFFRDPQSYKALIGTIFPKLLDGRSPQEPLRIWTLGCSTGEEAYSLAMAFTECAEALGSKVPLQIFATDINPTCIDKARAGIYSKSIAADISPARLRRFFTEVESGYRIAKEIRERCVFSRHNVLDDPPFSRMDLISCRNMLIYMEPVLQQQVMPLLHYALKPGGILWLGSAETATSSRSLFELQDVRNKVYLRCPGISTPNTNFRMRAHDGMGTNSFAQTARGPREMPAADLKKEAERILLTQYVPPGVLISNSLEILQFRGDTSPYLTPAAGAASLNLLKMLREGLLVEVRAALLRCGETGRAVRAEGLRVKSESGFRTIAVDIVPIRSGPTKVPGYLVVFEEAAAVTAAAKVTVPSDPAQEELARLTHELAATREYLQSVIEQQDIVNADLQSANEEAQSAFEEMQSVNEELETSKEEIQSTNEELATVNDELNHRNIELNRLNDSLRLAGSYAESIVASVRSPLIVLDAALRVKTASTAFYETFLVTPMKTERRLIYDLGNGQWNIPALRTLLEELLPSEEKIHDFEVRHCFEQIGPRIMMLNAQRLTPGSESEPLIVLAIEDVTGRRALEDSLTTRASDLVKAGRSKDEFLAMLAHELHSPLAPMRNASEILLADEATPEAREEAQAMLIRQIGNMSRMVDDLLDVSRITEGKIELRQQVISLAAVFTAAASLVRPNMTARGQTLSVTLPADPIYLSADPTRLDQVFGNLLSNASKYSDHGCHVALSAELADVHGLQPPMVIVRVRDNGIGIAPEMQPHVFDLFMQATRSLDRAHGGLGIGLTLVQRLVKLHGGSVEVQSQGLGLGSEFTVRLPIIPDAKMAPPRDTRTPDASRRILIVDDNEDSARSMATLQRMRGHDTLTAFTGPEALIAAAKFLPEIVLLDIGLPGMDGYEVARCLRAMPGLDDTFIVAMTGYGSAEDRALAREAGFDEYMVKPGDFGLLRGWLRDGFQRKPL